MPSKRKAQNAKRKIIAALTTLSILFPLAGCENGNLFGRFHKKGSVGDVPTLLADAKTAMVNHEYNNAQEYFKRIIEQQPANSEALLGYAQASLPAAGLDLGTIIANIIRSQSGVPATVAEYNGINGIFSTAGVITISADDLLSGLENNIPALEEALGLTGSGENIISALEKIVKGQADGTMSADDPVVNINLAIAYILRAAIRVKDYIHISASSFNVSIPQTLSSSECDLATESVRDIKRAYHRVKAVAQKLLTSETSTINQIESDVREIIEGTSTSDSDSFKNQLSSKGCTPSATDLNITIDPLLQ